MDKKRIFDLLIKGNSIADIARIVNESYERVYGIVNREFPHIKELQHFKDNKTDLFYGLQSMAYGQILDKMPNASFRDLVGAMCILEDKIRLREGQSTQNVSIALRIEDLIDKKDKIKDRLKEDGVPEHLLEHKLEETLALPDARALPCIKVEERIEQQQETFTFSSA